MVDINDEADENAHINEEDPKVIKIIHATQEHKFMVDTVLRSEEGISHDAFNENNDDENEDNDDDEDENKPIKS